MQYPYMRLYLPPYNLPSTSLSSSSPLTSLTQKYLGKNKSKNNTLSSAYSNDHTTETGLAGEIEELYFPSHFEQSGQKDPKQEQNLKNQIKNTSKTLLSQLDNLSDMERLDQQSTSQKNKSNRVSQKHLIEGEQEDLDLLDVTQELKTENLDLEGISCISDDDSISDQLQNNKKNFPLNQLEKMMLEQKGKTQFQLAYNTIQQSINQDLKTQSVASKEYKLKQLKQSKTIKQKDTNLRFSFLSYDGRAKNLIDQIIEGSPCLHHNIPMSVRLKRQASCSNSSQHDAEFSKKSTIQQSSIKATTKKSELTDKKMQSKSPRKSLRSFLQNSFQMTPKNAKHTQDDDDRDDGDGYVKEDSDENREDSDNPNEKADNTQECSDQQSQKSGSSFDQDNSYGIEMIKIEGQEDEKTREEYKNCPLFSLQSLQI